MSKYQSLAKIAFAGYEAHKDDPETMKFFTGLIAEGLYRTPAIHTGLISEKAASRPAGTSITKEHFFGRQASAEKIMEQIATGKSFKPILLLIKSRSRVHYTTNQENTNLKSVNDLFWREAYKKLNINLIQYIPRNKKYMYKVGGITYNSAKEAAAQFKITPEAAAYRFKSKSSKYKEWIRERID